MEKITKSIFCCFLMAFMCTLVLQAQSSGDKEVIIIEKIKDENGNIISKKILRSSDGDLSDEEIEKELKETRQYGGFEGFFDPKVFEFGNNGLFGSENNNKPTLGVILSFEDGAARVTEVVNGSGAEEAELQEGDIIVSVDGLVVNTIDDIKDYFKDKTEGDQVLLSIIREDQTLEKQVELKNNRFNSILGNIDPEQFKDFGQMFDLDGFNNLFDMDSLLRNFGEGRKMPFDFGLPNYSEREVEENKPSLGVFIEETDEGIIISEIMEDSAAERAKLKVNDKILKIDGNEIKSFDDLARLIRAAGKDTKLMITYERNGKKRDAEVMLN